MTTPRHDLEAAQGQHDKGDHRLCYFPTCKTRGTGAARPAYHDGGHAGWCIKAGTEEETNV